jgi:hypothetical protein
MSGFIEGEDRNQATLFLESLDEYIAEDSAVRVIDVFIDNLGGSGGFWKVSLRRAANRLRAITLDLPRYQLL